MSDPLFDRLVAHLGEVAEIVLTAPVTLGDAFHYWNILAFAALGYLSYRWYPAQHGNRRFSLARFFKFLFPWQIYSHRSARVDYGIYLVNLLISPLLLVGAGLQALLSVWGRQLSGGAEWW